MTIRKNSVASPSGVLVTISMGMQSGKFKHALTFSADIYTTYKVLRSNVVKDFVSVAGLFNVTHLIVFTKTQVASYMKICRLPRGPTITYRIDEYSLCRDVVSSLKRPVNYEKLFAHHPFLVLNNFSGEGLHIKLMTTMFQTIFPSINVHKVNLNRIRRCVLFNYNQEDKTVEFRHYAIKVVPCGMSRGVKKIVQSKIPNLARFEDISELMTKGGTLSESEAELDGPHNEVVLPQKISSRGNMVSQKSAIRLTELGPRLKLTLFKIQEGMMKGDILYHHISREEREKCSKAESVTIPVTSEEEPLHSDS